MNILRAIKETGFSGFVGLEGGYTIDTDEAVEQFKQNIVTPVFGSLQS
ncbi:hypothetical protein M5X06_07490 [Paenibacillus alvei]|uniref:Uncharacterized protein n=1 Tax=Paenibacillus alvei TaxID=44250 RepID=A0ABT4GRD2_PAEAL|nr:hypothetical protein [Paenibacillus alvei]MCY9759258.1 hypothetical protein [Paenibacillus alvei]MCY9766675.1 hypothetical protein [Paenibacillus alvei]